MKIYWMLQTDPSTRRAVMGLYSPELDLGADKKDIPCTLTLQFIVRRHELDLIVSMRSNDLWLGFPNDVFCFCVLQCWMASHLGIGIGTYYHLAGSMHLYEKNWDLALQASQTFGFHDGFSFTGSTQSPKQEIKDIVNAEEHIRTHNMSLEDVENTFPLDSFARELLEPLCVP